MSKQLTIIGAGPIGIEAGLAAKEFGYEVTVYEGGEIAAAVQSWGHVRMFSPFGMNSSQRGVALLRQLGCEVPDATALLTGAEYAEQYLLPLGRELGVKTRHQVKAIARDGVGKGDHIMEPARASTRFRLLVESDGVEFHSFADVLFDCSGVFDQPNPLGDGGIPAVGEKAFREVIRYGLGECSDWSVYAGKRTLVVGGGHSASTAVVALAELVGATVKWVIKGQGVLPCARISADPLPERDQLSARANEYVSSGRVDFAGGRTVYSLNRGEHGMVVTLRKEDGEMEQTEVDWIIAATGYRPDLRLARELQVQTCWATEGTYPLAASLLGETGGNCLAISGFGPETLEHPEPGYYALGVKSYGRTPDFLIQTGREQVESLLQKLQVQRDS